MATDYHRISLQRVFHLFHRGTEHGTADEADADGFFVTFVHTAGKSKEKNEEWRMKDEEFATAHHFFAFSSHFFARLSQNYAEYPRYLEG